MRRIALGDPLRPATTEAKLDWIINSLKEIERASHEEEQTGNLSTALQAASTTEALTGTNATKGVTPDALAALWEKGGDVESGGTISLGEGGYFHVTGTTTITDIDFATAKDGRWAVLVFDGVLTLTHHATTLVLPGAANITTAAGDVCLVVQDSVDNVKVAWYTRAAVAP